MPLSGPHKTFPIQPLSSTKRPAPPVYRPPAALQRSAVAPAPRTVAWAAPASAAPVVDPAGRNQIAGVGITTGQVAATGVITGVQHTAAIASTVGITTGNVLGAAAASSIAAPVSLVGAVRSGRKGIRADRRHDAIRAFRGPDWAAMAGRVRSPVEAGWLEEVNDIAAFAEQKTGKRVERMAIRTGLSTVAAAGGITALAGGIV